MEEEARTEKLYTRVGKTLERAFRIKAATLDLKPPDAFEAAVRAWAESAEPLTTPVTTHCPNCQATLRVTVDQTDLIELPIAAVGDPLDQSPLVAEFLRLLEEEPGGRDENLSKYVVQELNRRITNRRPSTTSPPA